MATNILTKNVTRHSKNLIVLNSAKYAVQLVLIAGKSYASSAYIHQVGNQPLQYKNVGQQVLRAAEKYAKRPAVISCHEDFQLTFAEAKAEAEILALKLKDLGLQQGEHLGIWAPNTIQWYICFMAAALGGFPLVCINPALQEMEVKYALKKAKVHTLITMDECGKQNFYGILKKVLPHLKGNTDTIEEPTVPELRRVLMKSNKQTIEYLNYEQVLKTAMRLQGIAHLNVKIPEISPESPCNIQFTSGTTGQPKAALLTHFNYTNVGHYFGRYLRLHESHKYICFTVPFFHAFGLGVLMGALDHGATLVLPSASFNAPAALEAIEKERCHSVLGTPTMFVDLTEQQRIMKKSMQSLELGLVGGAACSPEVFTNSKAVLRLPEMRIAYGLTEATSAIFTQDGTESELDVGKLYEHGEAKVINDKGETVAFGEPGELCVRGYFTMSGYFEDEVQTGKVLSLDGWLKTGDEFVLESTGIGRIVGRKKDVIIRGGENIFPKEIEDYLDTHPNVLEAQIIGVPDERLGEEICAFLRLRTKETKLSSEDIKQFCYGKLAHFKIPRYVRIVEQFPKTNSGKIQKFKLKQLYKNSK